MYGLKVVEKQTIKTVIDLNSKVIKWYLDEAFLYSTEIREELLKAPICPLATLYSNGDTIKFID